MCPVFVLLDTDENKSMRMNQDFAMASKVKMTESTKVLPNEATGKKRMAEHGTIKETNVDV